jgi:hypothetical protein
VSRDPHSVHRTRHRVGNTTLAVLKPVLRHSSSRRAWILRGIGDHWGPVLVEKRH